jgi:tetratricopeptide (TPR) repeat protein
MEYCEIHRLKGNYLFLETFYPKAAEQYQLALSYYEYCFPTDDELQLKLDLLRYACLCNISLCFYKMGLWRLALNNANQVLNEDKFNVKALFRRAQAYRAMYEYRYIEYSYICIFPCYSKICSMYWRKTYRPVVDVSMSVGRRIMESQWKFDTNIHNMGIFISFLNYS